MAEAVKIADEMVDLGVDHLRAFDKACDLLAARMMLQAAPQPIDLSRLGIPSSPRL
jgi:hypothetical protein